MPGIDECLAQVMTIAGARGAAIIDADSGLLVAAVGDGGPAGWEETAAATADIVQAVLSAPVYRAALPTEVTVTGPGGTHLVSRASAAHGGLYLHVHLDPDRGNIALARHGVRCAVTVLAQPSHQPPDRELLVRLQEGLRELP